MPCRMAATPDRITFGSMTGRGVQAVCDGADDHAFRAALPSDTPPEVCRSRAIDPKTF